jgi:hypothetical protein
MFHGDWPVSVQFELAAVNSDDSLIVSFKRSGDDRSRQKAVIHRGASSGARTASAEQCDAAWLEVGCPDGTFQLYRCHAARLRAPLACRFHSSMIVSLPTFTCVSFSWAPAILTSLRPPLISAASPLAQPQQIWDWSSSRPQIQVHALGAGSVPDTRKKLDNEKKMAKNANELGHQLGHDLRCRG